MRITFIEDRGAKRDTVAMPSWGFENGGGGVVVE